MAQEARLAETIAEQEASWRERPLLRRVYGEWFDLIAARLALVEGPTIEVGCGFAPLRERLPDVIATDVEPTPWADAVADAQSLPFPDASLASIVGVDVVHHLAEPALFLDEARRTLRPGGRLVVVEPYTSPLWTILYRRFHHELTDPGIDPFAPDPRLAARAMEGNQALPAVLFFRRDAELRRRWPELRIVERRRFAFVLYPLSGGFTRRPLVPVAAYRPLSAVERVLSPAAPLIASRCLVVLEREPLQAAGGTAQAAVPSSR
jgi:SAM-dependent methyltransferase